MKALHDTVYDGERRTVDMLNVVEVWFDVDQNDDEGLSDADRDSDSEMAEIIEINCLNIGSRRLSLAVA
jgi:hypothetical protein